jgi:hypothetical protein
MRTLAILTTTLGLLAAGPAAWACGNAVYMKTEAAHRLLARVEKLLEADRPRDVARMLDDDLEVDDAAVSQRLRIARATAWIRTGQSTLGVRQLRRLIPKSSQDPVHLSRIAEGMAGSKAGAEQALRSLQALAEDDLIPEAHGWASLARLRAARGDAAGAEEAWTRCRAMAKAKSICTPAADRHAPVKRELPNGLKAAPRPGA